MTKKPIPGFYYKFGKWWKIGELVSPMLKRRIENRLRRLKNREAAPLKPKPKKRAALVAAQKKARPKYGGTNG